ncbi:hypothetical protein I4U23_029788 [Adineta vaga]|nr:hypothetical protein I4U23_029788 [Adineta vaga]
MYHHYTPLTTSSSTGSMNLVANIYSQQEESEIIEDTIRTGGRKNKNEILALALSRLIKSKHLQGNKYLREMELAREVLVHLNSNEFILVLRTDGRIVTMSDEAEHHLNKTMRSLYTQCLNIFECLDENDGNKFRLILNSPLDTSRQEHRLVCTLRLPKGKRPSRVNQDIKTISMAGHFYSCHDAPSSTQNERLFVARCEALISETVNRSSSSQTTAITNISNNNSNAIMQLNLNEDMTIQTVSPNVQTILGYSQKDMADKWLGRYLATADIAEFESICQQYFQHAPEREQQPVSVCHLFDMYSNNGDGRLTFLCQIRPVRERRKSVKIAVFAQLVDPSLRREYQDYVQSRSGRNPKPVKAEQVNLGAPLSSSISQTSEDTVMANSPTFSNMAELIRDGTYGHDCIHQQQFSPLNGALSIAVAPFDVNDNFGNELLNFDYTQFSTTDNQYWSAESIKYDTFIDESADELESFIKGCY